MDRGNEGFPNGNLFPDNQQYNAYDNLFQAGADQSSYDASWGLNASNYGSLSRAQQPSAPNWPQSANHLSAPSPHANINGQPSPYSRSLSHSPVPYGQNAFSGYASQQNFQYQQPQYDPALVSPHAFNQNYNYSTSDYQTPNAATIAPHALQHDSRSPAYGRSSYDAPDSVMTNFNAPLSRPLETVNPNQLIAAIPKGKNGGRYSIIGFEDLANATKTERMGNFLNIGREAQNWDVNRAALPNYVPRKSRKELRQAAANDPKVRAKLSKKFMKKERMLVKASRPALAASALKSENIKYEDDSSSEEESSSDDDNSSFTEDDEVEESPPLPSKRPDKPIEATEYDTTKVLWRSKRKSVTSDSIKQGLGDFWEIAKTIRDRWKTDLAALQDAESKNRKNELPLLESRVKDQRDMMEAAFKASLKLVKGQQKTIVELFAENVALIFVCYQFLLDRTKADDYNGSLSRVILETMSHFTTINDDKLEKTHLVKVLPRFIKNGDAKTRHHAKEILANAAAYSKAKSNESPSKSTSTKDSKLSTTKDNASEPVAGVKRPASSMADGSAQKKVATGAAKANGTSTTSKPTDTTKKASLASDNFKPTIASNVVSKPKQAVAKPSGMFSSLQSASKKPGTSNASKAGQPGAPATSAKTVDRPGTASTTTAQAAAPKSTFSFIEAMANLSKPKEEKPNPKQESKKEPQETPEEKTKRLRKESRRHLHVQFKSGDELVQVRVFHHDPEEEIGHDASQMRDVSDVGGEGRMFKQQHQMMDIDEDEDTSEEAQALIEFTEPSSIDFSEVDSEERNRNYAPYGGGEVQPESPERAAREAYEAKTLIVFYTDVSDIPPNPREPADPHNGVPVGNIKKFAGPEAKYATRARQQSAEKDGQAPRYNDAPQIPAQNVPNSGYNLSNFMANQPPVQPQMQPSGNDAISNILASLKQASSSNQSNPPPNMGAFGGQYSSAPPNVSAYPTQQQQPVAPPSGTPDLAAILAQIQQHQPTAAQPPAMGGFNFNPAAPQPNMGAYAPPQMQQPSVFENPERKQWREGTDKRQNSAKNPWFKTKVCRYWQEGRCQKGDSCTYKHEEE